MAGANWRDRTRRRRGVASRASLYTEDRMSCSFFITSTSGLVGPTAYFEQITTRNRGSAADRSLRCVSLSWSRASRPSLRASRPCFRIVIVGVQEQNLLLEIGKPSRERCGQLIVACVTASVARFPPFASRVLPLLPKRGQNLLLEIGKPSRERCGQICLCVCHCRGRALEQKSVQISWSVEISFNEFCVRVFTG